MNRVAALAVAGRSSAAKFHELRLKYWNRDLDVVCCFEGSDDIEFYLPHVRQELALHRERVDFVNCGGKGVVLALRGWAKQKSWNLARVAFFADKDLDNYISGNLSGAQLYLTDYYSIESHVLDSDFFDNVWQDAFRLSITDARRPVWRGRYYSGAESLAKMLFPVIYMALAVKRAGGGVEFERLKLDEMVAINSDGEIARKTRRSTFAYKEVFVGAVPSVAEVRVARKDLSSADYVEWLRGKFLLWYAMCFFSRMKATLGSKREPNRAVVRASFSSDTAIGCLCSRMSRPRSLSVFLDDWSKLIVAGGLAPVGAPT